VIPKTKFIGERNLLFDRTRDEADGHYALNKNVNCPETKHFGKASKSYAYRTHDSRHPR
jgi:hypothetical protein